MKYRISPCGLKVQEYTRIDHKVMRWRDVFTFTTPKGASDALKTLTKSLDRNARIKDPALANLVKLSKEMPKRLAKV